MYILEALQKLLTTIALIYLIIFSISSILENRLRIYYVIKIKTIILIMTIIIGFIFVVYSLFFIIIMNTITIFHIIMLFMIFSVIISQIKVIHIMKKIYYSDNKEKDLFTITFENKDNQ